MPVKKEMFNMDVWSKLYHQTHKVALEPPSETKNLKLLCIKTQVNEYLDKCGFKLGAPKFPFSAKSKATWKYLPNNKTNNPRQRFL